MKRAFLVTEGGRNIGFGHITRCVSLSQALEEKGVSTRLVINGDNTFSGLLEDRDHLVFNWLKEEEKLLELIKNTDVIVMDSYLAGKRLYDRVSREGNILVMIDDYSRIEYPEGIVINPSIYGDKLRYPKNRGVHYLLGKDYIILRKEFWDVRRKNINKNLRSVLITLSGMDRGNLIEKIAPVLKKSYDLNLKIVQPKKKIISAKRLIDLMFRCDACISGSGQTTYELARIGVPSIGICLSGNQRMNAKTLQEKGAMEYIGGPKDKNLLKNLGSAIEKLSRQKIRIEMSMAGRRLVDGQGPRRIVGEVLKYADKN